MKTTEQKNEEFKQAALPLIKYLAENHHPHCTAIVESNGAVLHEGLMTTGIINDFIVD